jgi:Rrf2 family protein
MAIIKRETDYALRALARLGLEDGFMPVSTLAKDEAVPENFLRKIMQRLNRAGIVESCQGPFGGYRLAVPPRQITLLGVMAAVQGPPAVNECFEPVHKCPRADRCPVRERLCGLQEQVTALLDSVRLSDILDGMPSAKEAAK